MRVATLLLAVCLLLSVVAAAQSTNATVTGRVLDPSNAVIVGAKVEVINLGTNIRSSSETNQEGIYVVPNLLPGAYRIEVAKPNFKTIIKPDVVLHVQDVIAVNFTLPVGSTAESVTVTGGAPLINTQSGAVGTVVDRRFVENMPLNGRSFSTLIELTPGVVLVPRASQPGQGQFSVNGQRSTANAFIIDGVSGNVSISSGNIMTPSGGSLPATSVLGTTSNLVSLDALEEFRIQTSTYAPEFGRQPGAQLSVVTRSGTNEFHGALFNYFRNEKLDANDWFANNAGLMKPPLRQNDFGGVIGGPLVKDRTFFFFSYEGLRMLLPQPVATIYVPTMAARLAAPPETRPLLEAFPLPNGPELPDTNPPFTSMLAEFTTVYSVPSSLDAISVRLDQNLGKWRLFGRYNHAPSKTDFRDQSEPHVLSRIRSTTQTLTVGATATLTSNIVNELRGNWTRNSGGGFNRLVEIGGNVIPPDSSLFPSFVSSQEGVSTVAIQAITPTGGSPTFRVGRFADNRQRQFNLIDTLSVTKGSHQLKFGVDYQRLSPVFNPHPWSGFALFDGVPGVISGTASFVFVSTQETQLTYLYDNVSIFAQDTWRATPRLTLTYGLRWEFAPPPSEKDGRLPFTVIGLEDIATMTLAPQGTPLYMATKDNFAPRFGVAYHLSETHGIVLRGGFGLYYDLGNGLALRGAGGWPYSRSTFALNVPWPPDDATSTPPPFSLNPPYQFLLLSDPDLKLPRSYQWNLSLEKSLGPNQTVSATYVGQAGRRLLRAEQLSSTSTPTLNPDFLFPIVVRNEATSDYKALQLQFQRRLSSGLQALVNYTWSRATDEVSEEATFGLLPDELLDQADILERGRADFDVTHNFTAAVSYDIPTPPGAKGLVKAAIGDWSVDSIVRARSGTPFTVNAFAIIDGTFFLIRPDRVAGEPFWLSDPSAPGGKRLNPDAFDANAPFNEGRNGNLPRNAVTGLGAFQVDFALRRQFTLTERFGLQFRSEFFNIFNHPNFNNPFFPLKCPDVFGCGLIGDQATSMLGRSLGGGLNPLYTTGGPRSIQFSLRLSF